MTIFYVYRSYDASRRRVMLVGSNISLLCVIDQREIAILDAFSGGRTRNLRSQHRQWGGKNGNLSASLSAAKPSKYCDAARNIAQRSNRRWWRNKVAGIAVCRYQQLGARRSEMLISINGLCWPTLKRHIRVQFAVASPLGDWSMM